MASTLYPLHPQCAELVWARAQVQHNLQHMEFMGPHVVGVPLGSQSNNYRPNTVHGNVYNDRRIVRDLGVNQSEYGKPDVWRNLRCVLPDPASI